MADVLITPALGITEFKSGSDATAKFTMKYDEASDVLSFVSSSVNLLYISGAASEVVMQGTSSFAGTAATVIGGTESASFATTASFATSASFAPGGTPEGVFSASIQVDHNATTNYAANQHFTQGNITTVGTVTAGDVSAILPTGLFSASIQVDHNATANYAANQHFTQGSITTVGTVTAGSVTGILPTGTVSASIQIDHNATANYAANQHFTQGSITTVGTIGTGTWQGDSIGTTWTDAKVTSIVAGTAIDISAGTGDVTINTDLSELTTSTSDADGDFFVVVDAADAQKKLTKANINLSGMNNDSGWTSNAGTVTSVGGGVGIDSSGGTTPSISFNGSELGLGGTLIATDHLVAVNGGVSNRQLISSIPLSIFNNDAGWTSNAGTVTSVAGGNGIDSTGGTTPSISLNLDELAVGGTLVGTDHLAAANATVSNKQLISSIPLSIFNNDAGWTSNAGTVTSVAGGVGIDSTGGTTPSISFNGSELTTSTTDSHGAYFIVVDGSNVSRKLTKANIALSGMNNDSGWTSNVGTVTSITVSAGAGMTGGGTITTSGTATLNVIGTSDRITVAADSIDIASTYVGQTSITTLGTISTGTVPAARVSSGTFGLGSFTFQGGKVTFPASTTTYASTRFTAAAGPTSPAAGDMWYNASNLLRYYDGTSKRTVANLTQGQTFTNKTFSTNCVWNGSSISTTYTDAKVTSVSGTTNRISVSPTTGAVAVDIASTYVGQTSITTLGTITTGTIPAARVSAGSFPSGEFNFVAVVDINDNTNSRLIVPVGANKWAT